VARPAGEQSDEARLFTVVTIAETAEIVSCRGGLLVQPHHTIDDHPPLDVLVVPGGYGTRRELDNERLLAWINRQHDKIEVTTSVCTGSFLLAATGMLDGKRATTHWGSIGHLRERFPGVIVVDDVRVIDEGRVITSAGVSAGIDMALAVVARMHGEDIARTTARDMEYEPIAAGR